MKKILYIFGILMFGSFLFKPLMERAQNSTDFIFDSRKVAHAAEQVESGCKFPWNSCRFNIPDPDFKTVFASTDPKKIGEDLYMNIFNAVEVNPDKKALEATAAANGMSAGKMSDVLAGDLETILFDNKNLTHQQAIQKVLLFQNQFAESKQLFDLKNEINLAAATNEMFMNGDESDSGFDLIADLGNIENLLFMKNDQIDVGGDFVPVNKSQNSGENKSNQNNSSNQTLAEKKQQSQNGGQQIDQSSSALNDEKNQNGSNITQTNGNPAVDASGQVVGAINCFTPTVLDKALNAFDQNNSIADSVTKSKTGQTQGSSNSNPGSTGGNPLEQTDGGAPINGAAGEGDINAVGAKVEPAPAGEWKKPGECNDVFCLSIKFVEKPAVAIYGESDNCIACHVEKMVEKIKYTVTHTLLPGKATGNILEPGICKSAALRVLSAVPFRFYVNLKPVLTPPNDDLINSVNIFDEWEKFVNVYKPFKSPPQNTEGSLKTETPLERATAAALAYAAPTITFQDLTEKIASEVEQINRNTAGEAAVVEVSLQSDIQGGFYASVQREMDQMNFFFATFQDIFRSLHEKANSNDAGTPACSTIPQIPECGSL